MLRTFPDRKYYFLLPIFIALVFYSFGSAHSQPENHTAFTTDAAVTRPMSSPLEPWDDRDGGLGLPGFGPHQLAATVGNKTAPDTPSFDKGKVTGKNSISLTVSLNPSDVIGGSVTHVTVSLSSTQSTSVVVDLSSSSPSVVPVPKTVTVIPPASSVTFKATTSRVSANTPVTITATHKLAAQSALLTVQPPAVQVSLSSIVLNPGSVLGGTVSQGTITLTAAAPTGGAVVSLSSNNTSEATVPSSVTVLAGSSSATFTAATRPVASNSSPTITASYNSTSKAATLSVTPPDVFSVLLNPSSISGGTSSQATVALSGAAPTGGAMVTLLSSNTAAATVPSSVTVLAGSSSATFTISTQPVAINSSSSISASLNSSSQVATLAVLAAPVTVSSISLNPISVVGGASSQVTVTMSAAAPTGGAMISLLSNNTSAATVPSSVTVLAGSSSATFTVATSPVTGSSSPSISASYNSSSQGAILTVMPPALSAVSLNPSSVTGGTSSQATVTLNGAAPTGGAVVALSSSNTAAATVPSTVTVLAGTSSATFSVSTNRVAVNSSSGISASFNSSSQSATLSVLDAPVTVSSISLNPISVVGGSPSQATVTLSATAPAGGAVVALLSSDASAATVPSSVTVPAGSSSATFAIATTTVESSTSSSITATYNSSSSAATLSVMLSAVVKNIVTDFGCTCNGVADDNAAFVAFNTWALNWQQTNSGMIELYIPPGSTAVVRAGAGRAFAVGIKQLLVVGDGATITDGGTGEGFFLGSNAVIQDNAHSARTATVAAGASAVTLLTPGETSLFTVGNWALMAGLDMQGNGYPPNPAFFDYVQVAGVNSGTGVVTFTAPLQNNYESTWPVYQPGSSESTDLGGPATLYALDPTWNCSIEYQGLTLNSSAESITDGRTVTFENVTCTGGGSIYPSQNQTWTAINLNDSGTSMQADKLVGTATFTNVTAESINFQSSSINEMVMTNSSVGILYGTPKNAIITDSTITELAVGAQYYGASNTFACTNCVIGSIVPTGASGPALGTYSMANGVMTVPNAAGPQPWAVPGANVYISGTQLNEYSATVIDLTQDSTNTYIHTSISGGYPSLPAASGGTSTSVSAYPVSPSGFSCTNCSGSLAAANASQTPTGDPFYSYANTTYSGNIYTGQSGIPVWGNLVEIKIIVSTPYTGVLSNLPLTLGTYAGSGTGVLNSTGGMVTWNPSINLKIAGERDIFPGSVAGTQPGDNITPPGIVRLFNRLITPYVSSNIGGESSSVYPTVTIVVITDGGLGGIDAPTAIRSFTASPSTVVSGSPFILEGDTTGATWVDRITKSVSRPKARPTPMVVFGH
jgi:hypothetical protein